MLRNCVSFAHMLDATPVMGYVAWGGVGWDGDVKILYLAHMLDPNVGPILEVFEDLLSVPHGFETQRL